MAKDGVRLLREHQLAPEFRKALRRAKSGDIAVPFWGVGAVKLLGLDKGYRLRVVCNLDHPGCNPFVIEALRKMKVKVRSHGRLHAKLYTTEELAIVGSSNASSNGLTVEGKDAQGWIELNVSSRDAEFVTGVRDEFQTLWDSEETIPVRAADIKRAKAQRNRLPSFNSLFSDNVSLFEAVRKAPDAFADVYVAIYDDDLSQCAKSQLGKFQDEAAGLPKSGFDASSIKNAWGYQLKGIPGPAWLIDISCKGKAPRYVGTARLLGLRFAVTNSDGEPENDLTPALRRTIVIAGQKFRPSLEERALFERHAKAILKRAGGKLLPLVTAVALIDKQG